MQLERTKEKSRSSTKRTLVLKFENWFSQRKLQHLYVHLLGCYKHLYFTSTVVMSAKLFVWCYEKTSSKKFRTFNAVFRESLFWAICKLITNMISRLVTHCWHWKLYKCIAECIFFLTCRNILIRFLIAIWYCLEGKIHTQILQVT